MKQIGPTICGGELILKTELVQIFKANGEHRIFVAMSEGGSIEMEPQSGDLQGLVSSLQLATEICAGKFFPKRVVSENGKPLKIKTILLNESGGDIESDNN